MDNHTFIGKRKIGRTDVCDFTDYQGIGRDPLYKRYESVNSIVKKYIDPSFIHFFAAPDYSSNEDVINWYIEEWKEIPERLVDLQGEKREKYITIKEKTHSQYKKILGSLSGEELQVMACALRYIDDDFIYCCDNKVFVIAWGMTPDVNKHIPKGELIHESPYKTKYKLTFDVGIFGKFKNAHDSQISMPAGTEISLSDVPEVYPDTGYSFVGWIPNPIGIVVNSDMSFAASYDKNIIPPTPPTPPHKQEPPMPPIPPRPSLANCKFNAGENGSIVGNSVIQKIVGSRILTTEIPSITPKKGYLFKGWDIEPLDYIVEGNTTFNALYEPKLPWYRRLWNWFTGNGCLNWLFWALLAILLLVLISWLLKDCRGCTRATNGVVDTEKFVTSAGDTIDNNGFIQPIELTNGRLPEGNAIVAPIRNEDGSISPIIRDPGVPPVVANRLFLFLENESDNIDDFAKDFKNAYPGEQYSIIGYDRDVKSLLIQIPDIEKDEIRRTINSRIPNHEFIVFDEEIYELNGHLSSTESSTPGWHLKAVNAQEGWQISQGDPSILVAVIDDGIDASHPIFKDRIVNAYNVYTQNNHLSKGEGHGTHTAGLAVGSKQFIAQGASGIAPHCSLMPVQVFDNNMCPLSALISGIMYSIHKGADVVNISIGPSFEGLNQLPVEVQTQIAQTQFKNVEKLWTRVCKLAAEKNTILVFAVGNDDIISSIPPENRSSAAITVGAVDPNLYPTDFTNYGPCTDISAPGKEIYSSFPINDFRSFDGTSMAAPIVSGTIALMKSLKKDLTVQEAFNVLYNTGLNVYGNMPPMVQVDLALDAVKRGDFNDIKIRPMTPVPDSTLIIEDIPDSWADLPFPIRNEDETVFEVITDRNEPYPLNDNLDDYESIRKLIAIYKQKIIELEGQLPENKRK